MLRSLIFDLQMVMGNGELALSPDEYILATLNLYLVRRRGGGAGRAGRAVIGCTCWLVRADGEASGATLDAATVHRGRGPVLDTKEVRLLLSRNHVSITWRTLVSRLLLAAGHHQHVSLHLATCQ